MVVCQIGLVQKRTTNHASLNGTKSWLSLSHNLQRKKQMNVVVHRFVHFVTQHKSNAPFATANLHRRSRNTPSHTHSLSKDALCTARHGLHVILQQPSAHSRCTMTTPIQWWLGATKHKSNNTNPTNVPKSMLLHAAKHLNHAREQKLCIWHCNEVRKLWSDEYKGIARAATQVAYDDKHGSACACMKQCSKKHQMQRATRNTKCTVTRALCAHNLERVHT